MTNREKLQKLVQDVFLLDPSEFSFDLARSAVETWDSFGVVSLAVGLQQTFGYHLTPEEANGIKGVNDIIKVLECKGISFE
jgi:acyl carrier protein